MTSLWPPYASGRFPVCTSLCLHEAWFYEPGSIALKKDRMGMRDYKSPGKSSTWLSGHPQSYTHTLLVWYQCQDKLCLWQPNPKQTPVGNSWTLPGWGTELPLPPPLQNPTAKITDHPELPHQMPQCFDAQILTPSLHPPNLWGCSSEPSSLCYTAAHSSSQETVFPLQRNQFTIM